jgi:hypothetical protein
MFGEIMEEFLIKNIQIRWKRILETSSIRKAFEFVSFFDSEFPHLIRRGDCIFPYVLYLYASSTARRRQNSCFLHDLQTG